MDKKNLFQFLIAILILCIVTLISITIGRYPISLDDIMNIILKNDVDSTVKMVFFGLRLPRIAMAIIAGIGLSVAGSVYQTIFKNPLSTPYIIVVSSVANLWSAVEIIYFSF